MSNKILIKHGENTPVKGQLDGYELGYSTKEEIIYFNNNKEIIPISAQVTGKFLTANMIKDTDKKMQELKSIFEKFEDINGKEYSYNLDDIYEFCFSRHINKE